MMLQIGNKRTSGGFTLIEAMVATAVLSLGLVIIYQTFFISLSAFNYYSNHLKAQLWMDEKIWQIQDSLRREEVLGAGQTRGEFIIGSESFNWDLNCNMTGNEDLYNLILKVSWKEGAREVSVLRAAYAMYNDLPAESEK